MELGIHSDGHHLSTEIIGFRRAIQQTFYDNPTIRGQCYKTFVSVIYEALVSGKFFRSNITSTLG
jgi:hypothetical protein